MATYPGSKIAQENLEVFADMHQWLVSDVTSVVKEVVEASQARPDKQVYMSLPRPGVSNISELQYIFFYNLSAYIFVLCN